MTHGITITCAHCGASTDFDLATSGLPMDHFRCTGCGKTWERCHGKPTVLENGFTYPGAVTIKETQMRQIRLAPSAGA